MPLTIGKQSTRRQQVFELGLMQHVQLGRVPAGLQVDPDPEPVYTVNVHDLAQDTQLHDNAKLVSWRYSAHDSLGNWVTGEVTAALPHVLTSLRFGDDRDNSYKVKHGLSNRPEVQAKDFQLRVLRIPGALVEGYWLKPSNDNGLFVHLGTISDDTHKDSTLHPIDEILNKTQPLKQHSPRR